MRKLGLYLLADTRRAALAALIFILLPLLMMPTSFIGVVIVGLVALRKGWKASAMLLAFIILPPVCFLITRQMPLFYNYALLVVQCVGVTLLALLLRRTGSWRLVLESASLVGVLIVLGVHAIVPNVKQVWLNLYAQHWQSLPWADMLRANAAKTQALVARAALVATGAAVFIGLTSIFLQLLLARWWETSIYTPGALKIEFNRIRLHRLFAVLFIVCSVGLYWRPVWLIDLYPVLCLPFMVAGLSIFHKMVSLRRWFVFPTIAAYVALFVVPFIMVMLLAGVGLVDSWCNVRKRLMGWYSS